MISPKTKKQLIKAGLAGAILSVGSTVLYGSGSVEIGTMSVPAVVPLFVAGGGASIITDLVHDQMNWSTTSAQKISDISSLAIASGISGAAAVGILKVSAGVPNANILPLFALAAASQAGAEYAEYKVFETADGMLIF
jgi:hypothetical protein